MQQTRKTLTLSKIVAPEGAPADPAELVREAIGRKLCIVATYNRTKIRLAPHILYTKHDDPFVDAVVLERDGQPPREIKIGQFKLAGLGDVALTRTRFVPQPGFDAADPRYAGQTLDVVQI